jgi:periplasmic protein CpxP/Spy
MKAKLLIALCLFVSVSFMAVAQQGGGQQRTVEERVKAVMDKLTPGLNLDKDQQAKTDSVYTDYYKSMHRLREQMQQGNRPDRSEFEKITADRDEKLKTVLTADQYKKFKDELEPTLRPQHGNRQ